MRGARIAYRLPYFHARMQVSREGEVVSFRSERDESRAPPARFEVRWQPGQPLPPAAPETLDFFLIERYVLYSSPADGLMRARIHHRPWPLRRAAVLHLASTLLAADGILEPSGPALAHAQAEPFDVEVWLPARV